MRPQDETLEVILYMSIVGMQNTRMGHSISLTLLFTAKTNARTMLASRVAEIERGKNKQTD